MGVEDVMKQVMVALENFWTELVGWIDQVFPPETRGKRLNHWVKVAAPFLIAALALFLCICCCRCCRSLFCGQRRRRHGRMMKAPGRNYRMPRHDFEIDPRSYFRNLRANPADELC